MQNWYPDEIRDTLPAGPLASQATLTRIAEYTNSHVVSSDAPHNLADAESTRSVLHDLSESFDTDSSSDDQGDDGERDVLNNSDSPDDQGVEQGVDSEQEEPGEENPSLSGNSGRISHNSARIVDGTAASKTFGYVLCFHCGLENTTLMVGKCFEFTRGRIYYHIGRSKSYFKT